MCGIIGYIGEREATPVLIQGLERLEYRGYDSSGIACIDPDHAKLLVFKAKGKIADLKVLLKGFRSSSSIGIGHTRWATHGQPSSKNAHPHVGSKGKVAVVHNGIVENYGALKKSLSSKGVRFKSETDTEVIAQLVERYDHGDLLSAVRRAANELEGFFAFVSISRNEPHRLVAFKRSNPLVIGVGKNEHFIASDVSAIVPYTKRVIYLDDDELVELESNRIRVTNLKRKSPIRKKVTQVKWNVDQAQKGGYPHFMLKEIHEQAYVAGEVLLKYVSRSNEIRIDTFSTKINRFLKQIKKVFFVSCGTAYHAGLVGQYMVEENARIPTDAIVASEFRYADPIVGKRDLVVLITQSGETADTLAALREAKTKGALTLAIVNVVGSTIAREADCVMYTHAGPEIGVASTKAYTAQLLTLALLSFHLGQMHKWLSKKKLKERISELLDLPHQIKHVLEYEEKINPIVRALYQNRNFLYLGRGYNFPNALEGALKLKEITYAHAHGYAAGEMKHGPIALIDETQPVVCLAPASKTYSKMLSNIEEINARNGIIVSVASQGDRVIKKLSRYVIEIPRVSEFFSPILTAIPLQIFAYKIAVLNGRDVDKPRNLAKSVTVE
jgi:glutamine---fructose-6-phosphate transaminase (isomerizing)